MSTGRYGDREQRVLVAHGHEAIRTSLVRALREGGFVTREASDLHAATRELGRFEPDLVVLDPFLDGDTARDLVRPFVAPMPRIAVVFVTAQKVSSDDVVTGLAFADDYVTAPARPVEVVARVRAVLRRTADDGDRVLRFADVVLDESGHEVWRGRERIDLTPLEFTLLRFLMLNARRVVSKTEILDNVWGDAFGRAGEVETYVSYLRKKLHAHGPPLLETIRGVGYVLRKPRASD